MDNFFFGEILGNTERWNGSQMLFPIKYQKGVATVAFNGFDQLPTSQQPVSVNMTFYPTFTATNVALAGSDLSVNKTPMQTINLLTIMMKSRAQDGADDVGTFFQADGSAYGGKAPMGLAGIVDDGTTLANYGGLSRATYSGLNATLTSTTTISLLKVRTLANAISDGRVAPTFAMTDYTTWAYFEQLLQPFQRNTYSDFQNMDAGTGYAAKGMIWDGLTVYKDRKVTTGTFYLINTNFLKFYGLNWWEGSPVSLADKQIKGNIYQYNPANATKAFTWTNWIKAYNQGAINGFMIMGGQLICTDPFRNGKLYNIAGV
ncbi:phage major capsid protein [Candidatus Dojkabacteria bacterium]|uniref:Phage major capsid protein n=1 Tax=Candidatus Dojkabacteria bacterium TaxID=2099670 RepID=A0A5C7J7Q0_9BACT|nr:MAG: phage major capsid protein [Candidatus Dojkabacteria bacterium]